MLVQLLENKCCAQNKCLYANSVIREMNVASYKIK